MKVVLRHRAFGSYAIDFPINWNIDPFKNKNWRHNLNSLRWLGDEKDLQKIEKCLRGFYNFHYVKKIKNPYHSEIRGDHTSAIRLSVLVSLKARFESEGVQSGIGICKKIIKQELFNLQRPEMYRAGHNHGLMVDLALLEFFKKDRDGLKESIDVEMILDRSADTMNGMWHASGLTKEHSVSYQEHNLPLAVKYFEIISELNLDNRTCVNVDCIIEESKRLLGYSLRENGEYFCLGDSFRKPNERVLNEFLNKGVGGTPYEILKPYSEKLGFYSNSNFFIYRSNVAGKDIHFAVTCCWDSHSHKQNDELSFCLDVDGVAVFDDPGLAPFVSKNEIAEMKSEANHSTVRVLGQRWSQYNENNSMIIGASASNDGFEVKMLLYRLLGLSVLRKIELYQGVLVVKDYIKGNVLFGESVSRLFVLEPQIYISESIGENQPVFLMRNGCAVAEVSCSSSGLGEEKFSEGDKINYASHEKFDVLKANTLQHIGVFDKNNIDVEMRLNVKLL